MAQLFDGSSALEATSAAVTVSPMTLAAWFRVASHDGSERSILSIGRSTSFAIYHRIMLDTTDAFSAGSAISGVGAAKSTGTVTAGIWHFGVGVFASSTDRRAYLDGGNEGANSTSKSPSSLNRTSIARTSSSDSGNYDYLNGEIAEAAVWNVALTPNEIAWLAKGFSPLLLSHRLANLVVYQDLVRAANRPGVGPQFNPVGSPTVSPHVRKISHGAVQAWPFQAELLQPYVLAFGECGLGAASRGDAAMPGLVDGITHTYREVAS
jgi:hypothetical protein